MYSPTLFTTRAKTEKYQDGAGAGSEYVSLENDPYSDYLHFGCGGTLSLVQQYPLAQDAQANAAQEVTQPLVPPAQSTRTPTQDRGLGCNGTSQGAVGNDLVGDSLVDRMFGIPNNVCDPYYDVPTKPLLH